MVSLRQGMCYFHFLTALHRWAQVIFLRQTIISAYNNKKRRGDKG